MQQLARSCKYGLACMAVLAGYCSADTNATRRFSARASMVRLVATL
jgi:hypothetical protein